MAWGRVLSVSLRNENSVLSTDLRSLHRSCGTSHSPILLGMAEF
ncbi:hypothetical protein PAMC26577_11640 [Caballeronia sordidicola]|uniref:Uncharacterized protein n=1 Tax=Caballeronia sordidicola TaxID=196367 RepID=A0A242MXT8_CABSO|nr:hypothetical protein PAMC26577_11640 [Caballeronia sordidicola]